MPQSDLSAKSLFNTNGIVAVVTGGGTGIGYMITKALAHNEARRIYIIGRRLKILQSAAQSINPAVVKPLECDVTDRAALLQAAATVEKEVGFVNLVIANAGIMGPRQLKLSPVDDSKPPTLHEWREHALTTPMEVFTKTYAVNTTSVYYTGLAFLGLLDAGNREANMGPDWKSQIVATSSIAGFSRLKSASFAYNTSKAATNHLCKMLSTRFGEWDIRVNVLCPGVFPSELAGGTMNMLGFGDGTQENEEPKFPKEMIPAERPGREEDIAGAILYLAGKAGQYLNGSVVVLDGGRLGTLSSTY